MTGSVWRHKKQLMVSKVLRPKLKAAFIRKHVLESGPLPGRNRIEPLLETDDLVVRPAEARDAEGDRCDLRPAY
jgi:hypothetical protein